jgi:hypothetical protein
MRKMIWIGVVVFIGLFLVAKEGLPVNPLKYKYLFRNTVLSESGKMELGAVLRGRVYYPKYFYYPAKNQYLVYSNVDRTGSFRKHSDKGEQQNRYTYALLDAQGQIIDTLETSLPFSERSGNLYGTTFYIPWLTTGKTEAVAYHKIHNQERNMSRQEFSDYFVSLYRMSDFVETIALRGLDDDKYEAGIVFKKNDSIEILLSSNRHSYMRRTFQEDKVTNHFGDLYLPDVSNAERYPLSEPLLGLVRLETKNTDPFTYYRHTTSNPFKIVKYVKTDGGGWNGIGKIYGVPLYVPGEQEGTAFMRFKAGEEVFRFRALEVVKADYLPIYNLGLRTFELPQNAQTPNGLVFMEFVQNMGDNRLGGGVFVVRPRSVDHPNADIPEGISEKRFNVLPLYLQAALMDPENTTELTIEDKNTHDWIPEIEYLKNLRVLNYNTSIKEVPDQLSLFPQLESLTMQGGSIVRVSPQLAQLRQLKYLSLSRNPLTEFPKGILALENLEHLDLNFTQVASIPEEFSKLQNLKFLDLIMTQVSSLPKSMLGMKKLYIYDGGSLEKQLPEEYHWLFKYRALEEDQGGDRNE